MHNLRDLAKMTEMLGDFYEIVEKDFGGQANFRRVLRRMKEFDEHVQRFGGVDRLFKKLEKL
jgi:hypothetical protein